MARLCHIRAYVMKLLMREDDQLFQSCNVDHSIDAFFTMTDCMPNISEEVLNMLNETENKMKPTSSVKQEKTR